MDASNPDQSQSRLPLRRVWIALVALVGVAVGLGAFTFSYAEGLSYFSSDPAACVNCHAMNPQFDAWNHSSHKAVATCNDCHTPHRFPDKWIVKGINGWNHSVAFTAGNYPDPIQIRDFNWNIALENCVACHQDLVAPVNQFKTDGYSLLSADTSIREAAAHSGEGELNCVRCHGNVGHGNAFGGALRSE